MKNLVIILLMLISISATSQPTIGYVDRQGTYNVESSDFDETVISGVEMSFERIVDTALTTEILRVKLSNPLGVFVTEYQILDVSRLDDEFGSIVYIGRSFFDDVIIFKYNFDVYEFYYNYTDTGDTSLYRGYRSGMLYQNKPR